MEEQRNVLGGPLVTCSVTPMTGFYRDGKCNTGPEDHGQHCVCILATEPFLKFSKSRGNDLSTPIPEYRFPGLKAGDRWCLCAARWHEAWEAGYAPYVVLEATNIATLEMIPLEVLKEFAATGTNKLQGDIRPN